MKIYRERMFFIDSKRQYNRRRLKEKEAKRTMENTLKNIEILTKNLLESIRKDFKKRNLKSKPP